MRLSELLEDIRPLETKGDLSGDVSSVCYDSRQCEKSSMFVAVSGLKVDGHDYIAEALKRGARFVVHEKNLPALPAGITAIRVGSSRESLSAIGRRFYGNPSRGLCLVAVMGTNGKTTVTYLLESIFQAAGYRSGVLGTVNYRYPGVTLPAPNTTPESFDMQRIMREMADAGVTHIAAEISSHAVALGRVDDCDFDLGIFTNLSQDHLDYHGTMENYFAAKKRFFSDILPRSTKKRRARMVVNLDDPWGRRLLAEVDLPALGFGMDTPGDVQAIHYKSSLEGIDAEILAPAGRLAIRSSLMGRFNMYNILAAVGAAVCLDVPPEAIAAGIAGLRHVPGRLERVSQAGEPFVFVDYAHTDDALGKALENMLPLRRARLITVFGCGGDRDRGKRPLMGLAAARFSDRVILTSDNPRSEDPMEIIGEIEAGIPGDLMEKVEPEMLAEAVPAKAYAVIPDRRSAIGKAIAMAGADDIVLIAGKGHEDYQILGDRRIHFDDRAVAREMLAEYFGERSRR